MEDSRKFWTPTDGVVSLNQIYKWIRQTAKHVDALFFDPVFEMLEKGQSLEVHWVKDGQECMKSIQRVA